MTKASVTNVDTTNTADTPAATTIGVLEGGDDHLLGILGNVGIPRSDTVNLLLPSSATLSMSSSSVQPVTKSTFPPPPPHWRLYQPQTDILSTQLHIDVNTPPVLPHTDYIIFRTKQSAIEGEEEQDPSLPVGVPCLFPVTDGECVDYSSSLSVLTRGVLQVFIKLLELLLKQPTLTQQQQTTQEQEHRHHLEETVQLVSHHLTNISVLLQRLRKHQAYQTIIHRLSAHRRETQRQIQQLQQLCAITQQHCNKLTQEPQQSERQTQAQSQSNRHREEAQTDTDTRATHSSREAAQLSLLLQIIEDSTS